MSSEALESLTRSLESLHGKVDRILDSLDRGNDNDARRSNAGPKPARAKSAYNEHMSNELATLRRTHPDVKHRERFAMAVKRWQEACDPTKEASEEPETTGRG